MNFSLEQNFVVVSTIGYEDEEGQLAINFQIHVEKLFDEADLLELGLIGCSSGIKIEYATRDYVTNENIAYYVHETSNLNHYAVRTMNNGILDYMKNKKGANRLEKNKSVATTHAEELSTMSRTMTPQRRFKSPLSKVQSRDLGSGTNLANSNSAKGNIVDRTISRGGSKVMIGDNSAKFLEGFGRIPEDGKDSARDEDALTNGFPNQDEDMAHSRSVYDSAATGSYLLPIFERKAENYQDPYFGLEGSMRGIQIYKYYLPDPIHDSSPSVLQRNSAANNESGAERRSKSFDHQKFAKKPPLSRPVKPANKGNDKKQPQPPGQPRPKFTRKLGKADSNISDEKDKPRQNRTPPKNSNNPGRSSIAKEKNGVLNSTQIKKETFITPTFSPTAHHRDSGFKNLPDPGINFEDPKNLQPSLRRKLKPTFKLLLPLPGNSRLVSPGSPKEALHTKNQTHQNDNDSRPMTTNPVRLNSSGFQASGTFESNLYSSNFLVKQQNNHLNTKNSEAFYNLYGSSNLLFEQNTLTTSRSIAQKKLSNNLEKKKWVNAPDLDELTNPGSSLFDFYLAQFTDKYHKDIKNLMTGFKTEVKNESLAATYNKKSSKFINQNNSYSEGERHRFSPTTNRSKLSHMLPIYSNNTTIQENNENDEDNQICIESDDDYDDQDFEAESDHEYQMKKEPSKKKMLLPERPRTKSANRKREELNHTRELDRKLNREHL